MVQCLTTLVSAITINILINSCASFGPTEQNVSILDPTYQSPSDANFFEAQTILKDIASQNAKSAQELGKLPELQDSVDKKDLKTLRDM